MLHHIAMFRAEGGVSDSDIAGIRSFVIVRRINELTTDRASIQSQELT